MEYLALAVLFYFILRTMSNLVRLMGGTENTQSQADPRGAAPARHTGWQGPSPREETGTARDEPTFWGEDIEEATWHDLENGSADAQNAAR